MLGLFFPLEVKDNNPKHQGDPAPEIGSAASFQAGLTV